MSHEIELKLRLSPTQARRLTTHPTLAAIQAAKSRLFNTYYDTSDLDLQRRGIALRLRRKGWSEWRMTVKGGGDNVGAGGLAQRLEWEAPTQPGVFVFDSVEDADLRAFLEAQEARLRPLFTTDFTRTAWCVREGRTLIEVALDRGGISAGPLHGDRASVTEKLCELELELVEGDCTDALFALAIELAGTLHLHPEIASKAERGYALATDRHAGPSKGFVSAIDKSMTPIDAFRGIALQCLTQLQRNEAGAGVGENPEYIHQARVAIRRLRSALRLFAPVLSADFLAVYAPRWRDLTNRLGGARDWDVFLAETLTPLEEAFPGNSDLAELRLRADERRAAAGANAASALTQPEYSRLLLAFTAALWRQSLPTIANTQGRWRKMELRRFAAKRLRRRWGRIKALQRGLKSSEVGRYHQLRIEFKKLRYALEFFAPLLPRKRLAVCLPMLARIQDLLGILNDQASALSFIRSLHPDRSPDALLDGWIAGRSQLLISALSDELKSFAACAKPW